MSGDFIYSEDLIPRRPAVFTGAGRRLLIIAAAVLAAEMIWLFVITPCMPLSTVEVETFEGLDRGTVLSLAGISERSSWFIVDPRKMERALEEYYLIDSAKVVKRFPDRLQIFLEPRTAVALSLARVQDRIVPVYFDKEGVIFRIGGDGAGSAVPILSGLVFDQPVPGMRLPPVFLPLLEDIDRIGRGAPELLNAVSEIRINRRPFDGFDLYLYPVHSPLKVRLESGISEDILRYMMLMVDVLGAGNSEIDEIDFRTGVASYAVKEAPPGE
ncbi:MAG: FtsQ-type POTRA domain-containing protein [Treponema sp.]|jgi:cell division protein FtsQ|nr:FtsQ-type POTRA domain-containing protein [Treponema sp.]